MANYTTGEPREPGHRNDPMRVCHLPDDALGDTKNSLHRYPSPEMVFDDHNLVSKYTYSSSNGNGT